MTHRFDPTSLREYDIRGLVDVDMNRDDVVRLGQAFGTYLRER